MDDHSLYRSNFSQQHVDPSGALTILSSSTTKGTCGGESESVVAYRVDNNYPDDVGYLVQKVTVCCEQEECPCLYPVPFAATSPQGYGGRCVTFYEVILGRESDFVYGGSRISRQDHFRVSHPEGTCGKRLIIGETRFYLRSVTGPITNRSPLNITIPWSGGCGVGTGILPAQRKKPAFWDKPPAEGPVVHMLSVAWRCCCDGNNVVDAVRAIYQRSVMY